MARTRSSSLRHGLRSVLLIAAVAVLAACAGGSGSSGEDGDAAGAPGGSPSDPAAGGDIRRADDDLLVRIDAGDGSEPVEYTLTCVGPVEGSHPRAQEACDHLAGLEAPFAPIPGDAMCAEVFGGPQTARVTGRWHGEEVDLELSRVDACRTSQWDGLGPLLDLPAG